MNILAIISGIVSLFAGFSLGRIGDKYGGHLNGPHHWIFGIVLVIIGIFYIKDIFGIFLIFFGIGLFISDLNDFLNKRFWSVDIPHKWKFWSIK
ncbi:MAG: hypothetical protein WC796_04525 [Candidatus Pacearchaeota archaeon]|jgi:hypothetical protein